MTLMYNMSHGVSQTDTMGKTFWTKEQLRTKDLTKMGAWQHLTNMGAWKHLTKMGAWQHVRTRRQHQRLNK